MKKRNIFTVGIFTLFYVVFGTLITLKQESVIYLPREQNFETCTAFSDAEKINVNGTRMYVKQQEGKPVVVLYHGNAGSACDRKFYTDIFSRAGYGYVVVEYAGYSNDTQSPSHEAIKQDVKNVVMYLKEQNVYEILVVGESIGTGVASYHASIAPPQKLLLLSPFTDLVAVAQKRFWFYPTSLLVNNVFNNVDALKNYHGFVMIIHGTSDDIILYDLGEKLYQSLATEKQFITVVGAGHNDLFEYKSTYTAIDTFLSYSEEE